jgi:hypothetical protein
VFEYHNIFWVGQDLIEDMKYAKNAKIDFSSYFEGSQKSNSYTVPFSYEAFGENSGYRNLFTVLNSTG